MPRTRKKKGENSTGREWDPQLIALNEFIEFLKEVAVKYERCKITSRNLHNAVTDQYEVFKNACEHSRVSGSLCEIPAPVVPDGRLGHSVHVEGQPSVDLLRFCEVEECEIIRLPRPAELPKNKAERKTQSATGTQLLTGSMDGQPVKKRRGRPKKIRPESISSPATGYTNKVQTMTNSSRSSSLGSPMQSGNMRTDVFGAANELITDSGSFIIENEEDRLDEEETEVNIQAPIMDFSVGFPDTVVQIKSEFIAGRSLSNGQSYMDGLYQEIAQEHDPLSVDPNEVDGTNDAVVNEQELNGEEKVVLPVYCDAVPIDPQISCLVYAPEESAVSIDGSREFILPMVNDSISESLEVSGVNNSQSSDSNYMENESHNNISIRSMQEITETSSDFEKNTSSDTITITEDGVKSNEKNDAQSKFSADQQGEQTTTSSPMKIIITSTCTVKSTIDPKHINTVVQHRSSEQPDSSETNTSERPEIVENETNSTQQSAKRKLDTSNLYENCTSLERQNHVAAKEGKTTTSVREAEKSSAGSSETSVNQCLSEFLLKLKDVLNEKEAPKSGAKSALSEFVDTLTTNKEPIKRENSSSQSRRCSPSKERLYDRRTSCRMSSREVSRSPSSRRMSRSSSYSAVSRSSSAGGRSSRSSSSRRRRHSPYDSRTSSRSPSLQSRPRSPHFKRKEFTFNRSEHRHYPRKIGRSRSPPRRGHSPPLKRAVYSPSPRGRSPSPRGRCPFPRGRSPSLKGRTSPPRGRSPSQRRRSPSRRRRSPSPRGRSLSPRGRSLSPRGRSPSPRGRNPSPRRNRRSPSPRRGRSPFPRGRSPSPRRPECSNYSRRNVDHRQASRRRPSPSKQSRRSPHKRPHSPPSPSVRPGHSRSSSVVTERMSLKSPKREYFEDSKIQKVEVDEFGRDQSKRYDIHGIRDFHRNVCHSPPKSSESFSYQSHCQRRPDSEKLSSRRMPSSHQHASKSKHHESKVQSRTASSSTTSALSRAPVEFQSSQMHPQLRHSPVRNSGTNWSESSGSPEYKSSDHVDIKPRMNLLPKIKKEPQSPSTWRNRSPPPPANIAAGKEKIVRKLPINPPPPPRISGR